MELSFSDRLQIVDLLPARGKLADMRIQQGILGKVKLTKEEVEVYKLTSDSQGHITWEGKPPVVPVPLKDYEILYLRKLVVEADKNGFITPYNLPVCERILGGKDVSTSQEVPGDGPNNGSGGDNPK